jgi:hypothetical protein
MCINAKPIPTNSSTSNSPEFMYGFGLIEGKIYQSSGMEIDNESRLLCYRIPEIHEDLNPLKMIERFREIEDGPDEENKTYTIVKQRN